MRRALAVAALLAAVGCGVKAPPRPPIEPRPAQAGAPAATDEGSKR
jgi:hypothetical protein